MMSWMQLSLDRDNVEALALAVAALLAGLVSAALYGRRRQWLNLALVLTAALALAIALCGVRVQSSPSAQSPPLALRIDGNGAIHPDDLLALPQARALSLTGDGPHPTQWRDLPAHPLAWQAGTQDALWLDFPRAIALGRQFMLSVRRSQPQPGWRLQLLAENQQVLADVGAGSASLAQLSVQWLPPAVETMVLQARLLDSAGKVIAQGPVPLQVTAALPLQVQGRFNAPSFDVRALNQLLTDGNAILDWQLTLGKEVVRSETARAALTAPNAMLVDAAYVERLSPAARAALLAQAGQGVPLVILAANAANTALWQRELGMTLEPQSPTTASEDTRRFSIAGAQLALTPAALNPAEQPSAPWSVSARDDRQRPWLWQRNYRQGRVYWIGVSDWHRYAISAPQALAAWWQGALDIVTLAGAGAGADAGTGAAAEADGDEVAGKARASWQLPDPLPLPGWRSEICARGVKAGASVQVEGMAPLRLQARSDQADSVCAALWPQRAGWLRFSSPAVAQPGMVYVYEADDWPAWQRGLRRDATAAYAARGLAASGGADVATITSRPAPGWPFGVVFALCMLTLWWREQRARSDS